MRTVSIVAAAFAFGIGTFAMTRDAHALGPVDLEIGLKAGGASNPFTTNTPNPLGFGLGGRAGIDIFGFYGGVQFTHYFGGSDQVSAAGIESGKISYHANLYGVDLGYGFALLSVLMIRPMIGIGNASIGSSTTTQGLFSATVGDQSGNNLYLELGGTALLELGLWYVGADANILGFPGLDHSQIAFAFNGQVGIKL
jgi:hypothetical protein